MILMIDNYDSFTYNLVQEMGKMGADIHVVRNDQVGVSELVSFDPAALIISPGPCTPNEAGISVDAILEFSGKVPIWWESVSATNPLSRHLAATL